MANSTKYQGWLHSGFYSGLAKLSVPLSSVLTTMLLAHKALTKEEMGVWVIFMTITSYQEIIRQGLVKTALVKYINYSDESEHKHVLTAAFILNAFITIVTSLILFFFAQYFSDILFAPALKQMLYIFQFGMLIMIPFSHFEWMMYGKTVFKGIFWTYVVRQGLSLLLVLVIYLYAGRISLNTMVIIYNLALLAATIVAYSFVKPFLSKTFAFSKKWLMQLLHFGKYVFGTNLSTTIFRSADQLMLSPILKTVVFNASQNVAMRVINLADIPSQTLGDILFPKSSRRENNENPAMIKYYYEKTVGASLCCILPIVIFVLLFPKLIIYIIAGPQYYDAAPYLQLISLSAIFLAYLKQYGVIIDSTGKPQVNFISITIIGAIQVTLCYFFIKYFGLMGAAYALLCSHVIGFIITQKILNRYFGVNFLNSFKYAFQFYPELFKLLTERINPRWKMQ